MKEKTAFERVQTARHAERPYTLDIIENIFTDFVEIKGDRRFSDDTALVCGFGRLENTEVLVLGHQKGRDLAQRRMRNFGMPKPEGYRKALRAMQLAEKFNRPIITFIDTPGAYPGIDAEERGQAEAIAHNLREIAALRVPIMVVVLGEGGSGGALAIGVGDRVLMLENAVYSVITPEGCAAILWKSAEQSAQAAQALRLTANDLRAFDLVDEIIPEPELWRISEEKGFTETCAKLKSSLVQGFAALKNLSPADLWQRRWTKLRKMGSWA